MGNAKALKRPAVIAGFTPVIKKTAAYTVKNSDAGALFKWNSATAFIFSLPPVSKTAAGVYFDFSIETAATSGTGHGVSPASTDRIFGAGTPTDNKDVYFATAGDAVGNGFRLISDGVDGWHLTAIFGTLTQEA
jgi:hypothetical protein